jgi:hypothetical protein
LEARRLGSGEADFQRTDGRGLRTEEISRKHPSEIGFAPVE